MDVATLLERAYSCVNQPCTYTLGAGGMDPTSPVPWNSARECDCSGFAPWTAGISRKSTDPFYASDGYWMNTDMMWADAQSSAGIFTRIDKLAVGAFGIYPSGNGHGHGHIVVLSAFNPNTNEPTHIIHCSLSNPADFAIQETGPEKMLGNPRTIWAWMKDVTT